MNIARYGGEVSNPTASSNAREPNDALVAEVAKSKAHSAFARYKVMAYVTGAMLLLLTFEMVAKYLFNGGAPVLGIWVAIVHGWIYVVYLVTVFQVWSFMRWDLSRMAVLIAGGLVPLLSFIVERKAEKWFADDLPARIEHSVRLARVIGSQAS